MVRYFPSHFLMHILVAVIQMGLSRWFGSSNCCFWHNILVSTLKSEKRVIGFPSWISQYERGVWIGASMCSGVLWQWGHPLSLIYGLVYLRLPLLNSSGIKSVILCSVPTTQNKTFIQLYYETKTSRKTNYPTYTIGFSNIGANKAPFGFAPFSRRQSVKRWRHNRGLAVVITSPLWLKSVLWSRAQY